MAARTAEQAMARQQWKKRIEKQAAARREERRERNTRERMAARREENFRLSRELIQFLACGGVFILLTAVKLFSSDHALPLRETLGRAMETNLDVQAVFSTIGDAFAGEDTDSAAGRLYQAVFQPGRLTADGAANSSTSGADIFAPLSASGDLSADTVHVWSGTLRDGAALETLWSYQAISTDDEIESENSTDNGGETKNIDGMENSNMGHSMRIRDNTVLYGGQPLPAGVQMEQAILNFDYAAPVQGTLTSAFGYREHPLEGGNRFHYGVDLAAETGTEILCFADGTVTAVGESSSYGKYCMVSHGGNCVSIYAHCSRISASSGQTVRMGEKIAEVGETGQTTGPHLHFELQQNGIYLNPIYYVV